MKGQRKDYTGKRFGYLTAVHPLEVGSNRSVIWRWICDCGKFKNAYPYAVKAGRVKSCGCKTYFLRNGYRINDESPIKKIFQRYISQAKRRNIEFSISLDEFKNLISQSCYYCGEHPNHISKTKFSSYKYNGLDRLDSSKGYIKENIVTCCGVCNTMKMDDALPNFLSKIKSIYEKHSYTSMMLGSEI